MDRLLSRPRPHDIMLSAEDTPMKLTIELTPETARRIRRHATSYGKSVEEYVLHLFSELPEAPVSSECETTLSLFEQWAEEDAALTPEEAAREDEDWQKIESNVQASRLTLPIPEM
jgi:hypothetical protein